MRHTFLLCGLVGMIVMMLAVPVSGGDLAPAAVSPGAMERFSGVDDRCPTFSWQGAPGAEGYELVVYELPPGFDPLSMAGLDGAVEMIFARLPGGVSSWTPPSESRLARGANHAWFVRALFDADAGNVAAASDWSAGRFFLVDQAPTAAEVREALEVLAAYAEHGGGAALTSDTAPATPADRAAAGKIAGIDSVGTGIAAIRGETPDPSGETYGVVGISNSSSGAGLGAMNTAGGADLVLDGSEDGETDLRLFQWGVDRASAGVEMFAFTNSISGSMDLLVQGNVQAIALVGDGAELTNVDADTLDGFDGAAFATDAEVTDLFGIHSSSYDHDLNYYNKGQFYNPWGGASIHWTNLTNVPADLADGDDDTTYSAQLPLALYGTTIGLNAVPCPSHGMYWWTSSQWDCSKIDGGNIRTNGTISNAHLADSSVTRSKIYGNEIPLYVIRDVCRGTDGTAVVTPEDECTTTLCGPLNTFWSCDHSCNQSSPAVCANPGLGYALSPVS